MNADSDIMRIEIRDPEGNILMDGEKLTDWSDIPFIMKVFSSDNFETNDRFYAINFNNGFQINQDA